MSSFNHINKPDTSPQLGSNEQCALLTIQSAELKRLLHRTEISGIPYTDQFYHLIEYNKRSSINI